MTSPRLELPHLHRLIRAALLAPSGDNCQPWHFRWDGHDLEIRLVAERADSLYDSDHLASWVSLGATLHHIRITAKALGFNCAVDLFPRDDENPVACLQFRPCEPQEDPLVAVIPSRCVNRRPYAPKPLEPIARHAFQQLAIGSAASFTLVEDRPTLQSVARVAAAQDRLLFENGTLHDGLYRWLRWTVAEQQRHGDGMPIEALELHPLERPAFRALRSSTLVGLSARLGLTRLLPWRNVCAYQRSAAMGLMSLPGHQPTDFVLGGELFERVWLTATLNGVAFQPIAGLIFLWLKCRFGRGEGLSLAHRILVESWGAQLTCLFPELRHRTPMTLFRLGYAPAPSARSRRLALEEVLTISPSTIPISSNTGLI